MIDNYDDNEENEDFDVDEMEDKLYKSRGKPRQIGKHSLKHDSIFRSTKQEKKQNEEDNFYQHIIDTNNTEFNISDDLHGEDDESNPSSINYYRSNKLKSKIRKLLQDNTQVKMDSKKRKPSKVDFNKYYEMIVNELSEYGYLKLEIFIELAGYFTLENYWNIFKLLDKKYSDVIVNELSEKYGVKEKINYIDFY